jgi:hypothetical protein
MDDSNKLRRTIRRVGAVLSSLISLLIIRIGSIANEGTDDFAMVAGVISLAGALLYLILSIVIGPSGPDDF